MNHLGAHLVTRLRSVRLGCAPLSRLVALLVLGSSQLRAELT
jgi:hypothetical protein